MSFFKKVEEKIKNAPKPPGVYVFYEKCRPLYVGKASNLKNRLGSYLGGEDFKSERLRKAATSLKIIPLRSEIEALIREAKLIKELNPAYNVLWRDDASYFYAVFTKEKFPRIFVAHKNSLKIKNWKLKIAAVGPFTEGRALKLTLKLLRRRFPYCDCKIPHLRLCLNFQIGNCPGFCCSKNMPASKEEAARYRKNIKVIRNFLIGKPLKDFFKNLKKEEREALEKVLAHREFLENFDTKSKKSEQHPNVPNKKRNYSERSDEFADLDYARVEGYDISHLSGKETIGVMTHWEFDGAKLEPQKNLWRRFIIRTAKPGDDPRAIYETLSRRLNHPEWTHPDLIIIDGGAAQFRAAQKAFAENRKLEDKVKIISFAKPEEKVHGIGENPINVKSAPKELQKIIPQVVQETHNFAIRSHRRKRDSTFLLKATGR